MHRTIRIKLCVYPHCCTSQLMVLILPLSPIALLYSYRFCVRQPYARHMRHWHGTPRIHVCNYCVCNLARDILDQRRMSCVIQFSQLAILPPCEPISSVARESVTFGRRESRWLPVSR